MPIDIEAVVRRGYERTVARNGLLLAAILFVISILDRAFYVAWERQVIPADDIGPVPDVATGSPPVSLGLDPFLAGILSLLLGLVALVVTIGALRTLVSDETETLPPEHFTDNILWPGINLIVGGIVVGIAVAIGFVLLIVPGLFLIVSLFLWEVSVATENDNFIEGFRESWDLTSGRRWRLFALGIVVFLTVVVVSIAFGIPALVLPGTAGFLIEQVGSALVGVFVLAIVAEIYTRLVTLSDEPA